MKLMVPIETEKKRGGMELERNWGIQKGIWRNW